jgi:nicotinamidase-related amidase
MGQAIYLVLDMMNDLIHVDGPNGQAPYGVQSRERNIIRNTRTAIDKARAAGIPVGFVRVGFSSDYRECPPGSPIFSGAKKLGIFRLGTWGTETHPDLGQRPEDIDIIKHRVSPFYSTTLEAVLKAKDITRIYCSGISTNAVVQATVREGHDRDFAMTIIEDCCCGLSEDEHRIAMDSLKRFCQITDSTNVDFNTNA